MAYSTQVAVFHSLKSPRSITVSMNSKGEILLSYKKTDFPEQLPQYLNLGPEQIDDLITVLQYMRMEQENGRVSGDSPAN